MIRILGFCSGAAEALRERFPKGMVNDLGAARENESMCNLVNALTIPYKFRLTT